MTQTQINFELRTQEVQLLFESGSIDRKTYNRKMNKLKLKNPYSRW